MTVFEPPADATRAEALAAAQAFIELWVASLPGKRNWFVGQVAGRGGWAPDGSIDSLNVAEEFVAAHLVDNVPGVEPPGWKSVEHVDAGFSDYGLALVDGLAGYIAAILIPATATTWVVKNDAMHPDDLQPVLTKNVTPPWKLAENVCTRVARNRPPQLQQQVVYNVELVAAIAAQQAEGVEATKGIVVDIALHEDDDEWDAEVQIPEYAEDEIGFEAYASLEDRIAEVPGVVEAMGEDREIFLVRLTPEARANPESVRAGVQAIIDEYVRQAAGS